jgi:hypothetical protein
MPGEAPLHHAMYLLLRKRLDNTELRHHKIKTYR